MSGYRQHSYDPNAYERLGPPLRPYNRWQWLGVVLILASLAINIVYFAGRLGWISPLLDGSAGAVGLLLPGILLINSRRHPATDLAPELAPARKRLLIITVAICAAILGVAAAIDLTGAI